MAANNTLFFDVETPNQNNNSICSLGIIVIRNSQVILENNYLINPEAEFHERNIQIHHITPEMVEKSPAFPEVWANIKQYFNSCLVVGHNLAFDLSVLNKTLAAYDLADETDEIVYADTYYMAKKCYSLPKYTLDYVSEYLGIDLPEHHNSLCDARAAREIYEIIDKKFGWAQDDLKTKSFKDSKPACHERRKCITPGVNKGQPKKAKIDENIWKRNERTAIADRKEEREIDLKGKYCCITGTCSSGTREEISKRLADAGAIVVKGVTKKTDLLIVGGLGSAAWAFEGYGEKTKKALELKEQGIDIQIVSEKEVFRDI